MAYGLNTLGKFRQLTGQPFTRSYLGLQQPGVICSSVVQTCLDLAIIRLLKAMDILSPSKVDET